MMNLKQGSEIVNVVQSRYMQSILKYREALLGLLVLALPLLDFTGHFLKRPVMAYQARQNREL